MAYLRDIVHRLERSLHTVVRGTYDGRCKINYIRFTSEKSTENLTESRQTHQGIIYIGSWRQSDSPAQDCCALICGPTDRENPDYGQIWPKNVLVLSGEFSLMTVYELVQDELLSCVQFNEHKELMFEALESGSGIEGIIRAAFVYLENPIVVCDTSFSILENYPEHENILDFEIRGGRQYMKPASVDSMNREGLIERIFNEVHGFITWREELGMHMMYCGIRIHHICVGYVCILSDRRAFTQRDLEFAEVLCKMLSVEMQKSSFFTEKSGFKYEYFLSDLLEGSMENVPDVSARMAGLGRHPGMHHWIFIFAFEDLSLGHINNQYYLEQLLTILDNGMAAFYRGDIVVLLTGDGLFPMDEGTWIKLREFTSVNRILGAFSYRFEKLTDAPVYYAQARKLIEYGRERGMAGNFLDFGDYCMEILVSDSTPGGEGERFTRRQWLQAAVHPDLRQLEQYDQIHRTEYLRTLCMYLECGRNALRAAAVLHIHKSSFFYRLNRICEMIHLTPEDEDRFFEYEVSMKIGRMLK